MRWCDRTSGCRSQSAATGGLAVISRPPCGSPRPAMFSGYRFSDTCVGAVSFGVVAAVAHHLVLRRGLLLRRARQTEQPSANGYWARRRLRLSAQEPKRKGGVEEGVFLNWAVSAIIEAMLPGIGRVAT